MAALCKIFIMEISSIKIVIKLGIRDPDYVILEIALLLRELEGSRRILG